MRINLTKKELINTIYMQIGFSKRISENLLEDIMDIIIKNLKTNKQVKISKFGTFALRNKKKRIGRNPKTLQAFEIPAQNKVRFSPTAKAKYFLN